MVQGSSSLSAPILSPRLLISPMSSVAIASWIVVLIFLTVEKAILHAIGFELVAFTTRVMPCRSKITSAPANVLPVPQTSVGDWSKPNRLRFPTQASTRGNRLLTGVS
jgi:hypothetical protein